MFNDINQAIEYIESKRTKRTFLMFQETIEKYHFNINQKNMIHVAGTNGKGSTTTYIRDLLKNSGYHVGTFTSPYITNHNERICIDGQPISDDDLLRIINELVDIIEIEQLSMFEIDVLIMLKYFDEHDLDYRIIECGIGGLNDKTNVINSICSVITNIGYDHQFMLGDTLEDIAKAKAGIIKQDGILFTTEINKQLLDIFKDTCDRYHAKYHHINIPAINSYPYKMEFKDDIYYLENCGSYQVNNALLALNIVDSLITLETGIINKTLNSFTWPGRFENVNGIYLDGAHNIDGIYALVKTIEDQKIEDVGIIFSALNDKDIAEMLDKLSSYDVMLASFDDDRAIDNGTTYPDAIKQMQMKHRNVIITGSLHFISTVRKYLLREKIHD